MAVRWSSEHVVAEYKDLQANAMAVDCHGSYAILAGRRNLAIVNLIQGPKVSKKIPRTSKWEINAVQWNPHPSHSHLFVTACNQRADICGWSNVSSTQHGSLKAHTRVISDLDWSPDDPNTIATCSVDTFTYLWDIRDCRKPTVSLQAVAGASQVKWNKVNSHFLATTHDGDIRIWDPRKTIQPVQYIAGHLSKIHGLDWSPKSEYHLATSSQDCTVKFWDVNNPKQPTSKLPSGSPVWRARYTPFGDGLVTVVVPQLRRGENSLFLWYTADLQQPIHTFVGHTDVVLEFQWIHQKDDFQLVTWSKDQSLRLWRIDSHLQKLCGEESIDDSKSASVFIPTPSVSSNDTAPSSIVASSVDKLGVQSNGTSIRDHSEPSPPPQTMEKKWVETQRSPRQPKSLTQEFLLMNVNLSKVMIEDFDAIKRFCTVSCRIIHNFVKLTMFFPEMYPDKEAPTFQFLTESTVDNETQQRLKKVLDDTALQQVKHSHSCIEPCLRQLVNALENLVPSPEADTLYPNGPSPSANYLQLCKQYHNTYYNENIPFPRTSGARFCASGYLVCFTRKTKGIEKPRRTSSNNDLTPRALSALSLFQLPPRTQQPPQPFLFNVARSPPQSESASLTNYFNYKDRKQRPRSKSRLKESSLESKSKDSSSKKQAKTGPIIVYNVACLLSIHRELAVNYVLNDDDIASMCSKNASAAAAVGRKDLVQVWSLAALANDSSLKPDTDPDKGSPWGFHSFGRPLLESLIEHYSKIYDVQTLAMLCCVFGTKYDPHKESSSQAVSKSTSAYEVPHNIPFYGILSPPTSPECVYGPGFDSIPKVRRSNSWSDTYEEPRYIEEIKDPLDVERQMHEKNMSLLDPSKSWRYDQFKKVYADMLYQWQLLDKRAEVLKYLSNPTEQIRGIDFNIVCRQCKSEFRGSHHCSCDGLPFQCSICHITVKGTSSFCFFCGHGGHSQHMMDWFKTHNVCPTGCGCVCMKEDSKTL